MKIGLLQCDHVRPELLEHAGDYDEMFQAMFGRWAPEAGELEVYDVTEGELPDSPDECAGYLVSGSAHSVYEDSDVQWIGHLAAFIRTLHERRGRLVGICFGHQMIAHALGGEVELSERGWGVGSKEVRLNRSLGDLPPSVRLLVSHADQVTLLPEGAEVIASNVHCPNSIIAVGEHFVGIQGHPEFTTEYARGLMQARAGQIPEDVMLAALPTFTEPLDAPYVAKWIAKFLTRR